MDKSLKKIIIISAINFRNGGPLSILQDCLSYADKSLYSDYRIIALVHNKNLLKKMENIEFIEFPKSVSSYLYRIYYEYFYFKKISQQLNPWLWLSLHDMTPNIHAQLQAVYCHNPSPFYTITFKEFWLDPKFFFFNLFYKYLYKINIQKNQFVIVQQEWLRHKFESFFGNKNIIVAHPEIKLDQHTHLREETDNEQTYHFFFPTLPRVFKNIDVICQAVKILNTKDIPPFKVTLTINGTENRYANALYKSYKDIKGLAFIGKISRDEVFHIYQNTDCLIFPSKLETWGMPITEFQNYDKPMLIADLEYAHETVGNYKKTKFFHPDDPENLAKQMEKAINHQLVYDTPKSHPIPQPFVHNWKELFNILLKGNI